ncbi:hypothetical protein Cgig2_031852 [Carnegiea gigantea]|uniref:Ubiquitin fusion degradaton protein n=1 Tax=Carnegiea gigantea TaxID=171969 RepID=A0A9Q1KSM4_9CARY|nr:hypothetical protein Cgig2_031852 [Carnegiea gigantea]
MDPNPTLVNDQDTHDHDLDHDDIDHDHGNGDGDGDSGVDGDGDKTHLEAGNRIILPLSALDQLMDIGVGFPMLFYIENPTNARTSHCGVLEFSAEEGMVCMPDWMMNNMCFEHGDLVNIKSVALARASYIKLQPHSVAFLDIQDPKAVLEAAFCGGYSCLTVGDTIMILHDEKKLFIDVIDAKPSRAVCILETDCEVDFSPPLDYKEPPKQVAQRQEEVSGFAPFTGRARRLNEGIDDKLLADRVTDMAIGADSSAAKLSKERNSIVFGGISSSTSTGSKKKISKECQRDETPNKEHGFKPFTGKKYSLRD